MYVYCTKYSTDDPGVGRACVGVPWSSMCGMYVPLIACGMYLGNVYHGQREKGHSTCSD
jgi:hypothetical protein